MNADQGGMKVMYVVWGWLLIMTATEVALAYFHFPLLVMLLALLGLSIVKSILIVAYFMHLKFERVSLALTLVPAAVGCMLLMNIIFPDSLRMQDHGVFRDLPVPGPVAGTHDGSRDE
ncbi:MAG: cytochrome C oxidase subunit IV family protein [Acidobacteriota bacterium]